MEFVRPCYTNKQIGNQVRLKRLELGYSIEKVARDLDIKVETFDRIEKGQKALTSKEFKKISAFLQRDVMDLTKVQDDQALVYCRGTRDSQVEKTIERAQLIFHEFLGQKLLKG